MARYYVDVTGIPDELLEFLGYILVHENEEFQLRHYKGDPVIIQKSGKRYVYVDDINDAAILKRRPKVAAPPSRSTKAKSRPKR